MNPWSWWDSLWTETPPGAYSRVESRSRREVDGRVTEDRTIRVNVDPAGNVEIKGEIKSLTINGRRVRFKEPT